MPGYPGEDGLNEQQKRFYREWLIDYNATQAAIRAGYSPDAAHVTGCRLLKHAKGVEYLTQLTTEMNKKIDITREDVINEFRRIAMVDVRKFYDTNGKLKKIVDLDDDTAAALSGMKVSVDRSNDECHVVEYKLNSKNTALDKLGQHFNIYKDHEESGAGEMTVIIKGKDADL